MSSSEQKIQAENELAEDIAQHTEEKEPIAEPQENSDPAPMEKNDTEASEGNALEELTRELEREREARLISENKLLCISILEENSLPRELCEYLTAPSEEETRKRAVEISKIIKRAVNDEVGARLATVKTPSQSKNSMTRAEFKSLSLSDMQRLYKTDKELYKELTNKN